MSIDKYMEATWHEKPFEELKGNFSRFEHAEFHKGSSLKGRLVCVLLIPVHAAGIILKPLAYVAAATVLLAASIFFAIKSVFTGSRMDRANLREIFKTFVSISLTAPVVPIGQVAQLAKAIVGVAHPGAYFKRPAPSAPLGGPGSFTSENFVRAAYGAQVAGRVDPFAFGHRPHGFNIGDVVELDRPSFGGGSGRPIHDPVDLDDGGISEGEALTANGGTFYYRCNFKDPEDRPVETLHALAEGIRNSRAGEITVNYNDGRGIDAGGLRRDFMYRLFASLSARQKLQEGVIEWKEGNKQMLKDIGTVLRMQLKNVDFQEEGQPATQAEYPLGEVFHSGYFKGLLNYNYDQISGGFDFILQTDLVEILKEFVTDDEREHLQNVRALEEWDGTDLTGDAAKRHIATIEYARDTLCCDIPDAFGVAEFDPKALDENGNLIPKDLIAIKAAVIDGSFEGAKNRARALHTIGRAMNLNRRSWEFLRSFGHEHIKNHVQGQFSKQALKDCITFKGFTEEEKDRVKAFIDAQSEEELRRFLATITGSGAVPVPFVDNCGTLRDPLTLNRNPGYTAMIAHSCFNSVDIPGDWDMDRVIDNFGAYCAEDAAGFNRM